MDVCGQCHSNAIFPRQPAFSYRPGDPLDSCFRTLTADGLENEHVADQVKHLRQSKCFQNSKTLSCRTRHNPHRATENTAVHLSCHKCHKPIDCREQPRLPLAACDNCVACHMPQYNRVEVNFHTKDERVYFPVRPHNHRIAVYPAATQEVLLGWHRRSPMPRAVIRRRNLTRSLVDHWLAEGEKFRQAHRYLAALGAIHEALRLDPTPAAKAKQKEVLDIRLNLDADMYLAGHLYNEHRHKAAIETLEKVLKTKPDHAKGARQTRNSLRNDRTR